jgi:hypothetical protein
MAVTDSRGYRKVYVGKDHPMAQATGYAYEHRLKKAEAEGRVLSPEELVHHDDEITGNNELDNLEITSRPETRSNSQPEARHGPVLLRTRPRARSRRQVP